MVIGNGQEAWRFSLYVMDKLTATILTAHLPNLKSTHFFLPLAVYREMLLF